MPRGKSTSISDQIVQSEEEISKRSTGMGLRENRNIKYTTLTLVVLIGFLGIFFLYYSCRKTALPILDFGIMKIFGCY